MTTFNISTIDKAPSMNRTTVIVKSDSYKDVVQMAIDSWKETGRATSVHHGKYSSCYTWHCIHADGTFWDRNTNSGVPATGQHI